MNEWRVKVYAIFYCMICNYVQLGNNERPWQA